MKLFFHSICNDAIKLNDILYSSMLKRNFKHELKCVPRKQRFEDFEISCLQLLK